MGKETQSNPMFSLVSYFGTFKAFYFHVFTLLRYYKNNK